MALQVQKGDKTRYAADAVEALGANATYGEANRWLRKNGRPEISEPLFYHARKYYRDRVAVATQATPAAPVQATNTANTGIVALVNQAKALVAKLGKEEAKQLIDSL